MRSLLLAACAALAASALPAGAEEPLFLRIRPNDAASNAVDGSDGAGARRGAVWARSDARARLAIASVCTGCMRPTPVPPPHRHDATEITSNFGATTIVGTLETRAPAPSVAPAPLLTAAGQP